MNRASARSNAHKQPLGDAFFTFLFLQQVRMQRPRAIAVLLLHNRFHRAIFVNAVAAVWSREEANENYHIWRQVRYLIVPPRINGFIQPTYREAQDAIASSQVGEGGGCSFCELVGVVGTREARSFFWVEKGWTRTCSSRQLL